MKDFENEPVKWPDELQYKFHPTDGDMWEIVKSQIVEYLKLQASKWHILNSLSNQKPLEISPKISLDKLIEPQ